jgi:predicted transcriptional regulator
MSVTSIRLNSDVEIPLEQLAEKLDRSKNYLINQAVKEFVARHSMEEARWLDTLEAIQSVQSGKLVSEEVATDWLKSWGTDKENKPPKA